MFIGLVGDSRCQDQRPSRRIRILRLAGGFGADFCDPPILQTVELYQHTRNGTEMPGRPSMPVLTGGLKEIGDPTKPDFQKGLQMRNPPCVSLCLCILVEVSAEQDFSAHEHSAPVASHGRRYHAHRRSCRVSIWPAPCRDFVGKNALGFAGCRIEDFGFNKAQSG